MSTQRSKESAVSKRNKTEGGADRGTSNELHELFLAELGDIYNAEQQLTKALPKMAKAAKSAELREAIESHLEETERHVSRLEEVAASLDETLKSRKCKAMEGLIKEGEEMIEDKQDSVALDAGLIIAAQKVEHYEIASYGGLCSWAELMGHNEALELLRETLEEEKGADEKLTEIAESAANEKARQE